MIYGNVEIDVLDIAESLGIDVVGEGRGELYCLCPFHDDRMPSFNINVESGLWHCFSGCGSGNITTLVERLEGLDTWNAMIWINNNGKEISPQYIRRTLIKLKNPRESDSFIDEKEIEPYKARMHKYMFDRGFSKEVLHKWEIGYNKNIKRIVIPARDLVGRLRGVIYRSIKPEVKPRYVYSSGFQKERIIFGLDKYEKGVDKEYILVEGSLDAIWLDQCGFNGIALLGSTMSAEQEKLLKSYCSSLILCLDNDQAGIMGKEYITKRLGSYINIHVVEMQGYKDVQEMNKEEIARMINCKVNRLTRRLKSEQGTNVKRVGQKN